MAGTVPFLDACAEPGHENLVPDMDDGRVTTMLRFAFRYWSTDLAAGASIEFLKPAHLDDVLTCEGVEQVLQGRHGVYDMKVTNQRGEVVAVFRGKSATIQGTVIPEEP